MPDPTFHPWPGHPCATHGCDGCVICQVGGCCGSHAAGAQPPADSLANWRAALHSLVSQDGVSVRPSLTATRPLPTLVGQQHVGSLPTSPLAKAIPAFPSAKRGAAA